MHAPLKIFIDTNVWFSYFHSSANCEKLIKAHVKGKIEGVISKQVLEELVINLKKKLPSSLPSFNVLMQSRPPIILLDPPKVAPQVIQNVHPKDQKIFQSAVNAKVKYFITGNTKHYNVNHLQKLYNIQILTPSQAANKLNL